MKIGVVEMKKFISILILVVALGTALTGCGSSTFTRSDERNARYYDDPITAYEESRDADYPYQKNHCRNINVQERVFYGDLKSILNRGSLEALVEAKGLCTRAGNGFQTYPGFAQYEVNGGTNRCSWWSQHGIKVYVNFIKGYRQAAVVTIDVTGGGWPRGGGQGFPTSRMQFRNALIDCNREDLTINIDTGRGLLQITAPKETGNKYSSNFRGSLSFNGSVISRGLFYITR